MNQIEWLNDIIIRATNEKLYGAVVINFQNGIVSTVRTEKIEKPPLVINK